MTRLNFGLFLWLWIRQMGTLNRSSSVLEEWCDTLQRSPLLNQIMVRDVWANGRRALDQSGKQ